MEHYSVDDTIARLDQEIAVKSKRGRLIIGMGMRLYDELHARRLVSSGHPPQAGSSYNSLYRLKHVCGIRGMPEWEFFIDVLNA